MKTSEKIYCDNGIKKSVGRPKEEITKKVSLTLSENEWKLLDQAAKRNRARFLKMIVREVLMK